MLHIEKFLRYCTWSSSIFSFNNQCRQEVLQAIPFQQWLLGHNTTSFSADSEDRETRRAFPLHLISSEAYAWMWRYGFFLLDLAWMLPSWYSPHIRMGTQTPSLVPILLPGLLWVRSHPFLVKCFIESQVGWGWKGPVEAIWSNPCSS